jgi:flagellar biosynthesis protein FlhF
MAIRKFVAPTTREAMMQVRRELGDDAVIIANRRVGNRIEILAAAPDAVDALVERSEQRSPASREQIPATDRPAVRTEQRPKVEAFQDFVRRQMQNDAAAASGDLPQRAREMPAREVPVRANAAPAHRGLGANSGVAMYHDVAEYEQEELATPEAPQVERAPQRAAAPAAQPRRTVSAPALQPQATEIANERPARAQATTLPNSHRAQQVETDAQPADPAVFRRRPAHVAAPARTQAPVQAAIAKATAQPVDILLEAQPAPHAAAVMQTAAPQAPVVARAAAPKVERNEVVEATSVIAAGHAAVPSLPLRSQAAPIATAARLREAWIKSAAEMAAVMTSTPTAAPAQAGPAPSQAEAVAAPVAQVNEPAPHPFATWSWEAQFVKTAPAHAPEVQAPAASETATPDAIESAPTIAIQTAPIPFAMPAAPVAVAAARLVVEPPASAAVPVAAVAAQPAAAAPAEPVATTAHVAEPAPSQVESQLLAELHSMRDMLRQQIATLAIKPAPEAAPAGTPATRVMTRLVTAGFSAEVARRIASYAPQNIDVTQTESWLLEVLSHNIRCAELNEGIVERAGRPATPGQVFALVGPTGVGKTTTVAKLAARFAVRHGTSALGLITLDAYRVAAPEQLRTYGRILGTPVHVAQDAAQLRELLSNMVHKRLVLIDTCGVSQRDDRLGAMLDLLAHAGIGNRPVQRVLLMNSASHAETLEEVAKAWRAHECAGAILTKLDEATRIGGSIDVSLRHRLNLLGVTNGQRVPEDWHAANNKLLAHLALKPAAQLFELAEDESAALVQAQTNPAGAHGAAHA